MFKSFLLDLGDTIFHPDWEKINEEMIKSTGITVFMPDDIKKIYSGEVLVGKESMKSIFRRLIERFNPGVDVDEVIEVYSVLYKKHSKVNQKMVSLLKKLKNKGYKMYALSNTNEIHKRINEEKGIFSLFEKSYLSFEIGAKKPDEAAYKKFLEDTSLTAGETIYLDDNEKNIEAAKKLGFEAIIYVDYNLFEKELIQRGIL
ncbi:hypothetical protein CO038_02830 [Candidatus Pacearchaeota archaeon CG_4_9_14_0_2_um_filter_39_13]|nr:HAD-IA family hydrolase [Candidatus Pacearchaeota archaeon]OIO42861.1 MAG: hypothetical protein AUJ64_03425 [Candidatus Pacearchaeota archaeon CG1_02_39_14]PJC44622.1 MAG: hypothetical protein CO038_02830 [Candidatus Pacearchaeota archaeon CG_4_9_14_0_2_um_filter_39_13]